MNPLTWSDDELLRALSAALREPPVDALFICMAQAAFAWRTVDADLDWWRLGPARAGLVGRSGPRPGEYVN